MTKNYFLTAEINLATPVPLYTCFVYSENMNILIVIYDLLFDVPPGAYSNVIDFHSFPRIWSLLFSEFNWEEGAKSRTYCMLYFGRILSFCLFPFEIKYQFLLVILSHKIVHCIDVWTPRNLNVVDFYLSIFVQVCFHSWITISQIFELIFE